MSDLIIKGGNVLTSNGVTRSDLKIVDGRVAEIGNDLSGDEIIDASGTWVGPGFVDMHTHLRDPGQDWKEDIATGTRAAAAGGYTAVVAMPNTDPVVDNAQIALYVSQRGRLVGSTDVHPSGCLTMGGAGERMAHIDEMWDAGVRVFTDDGNSVESAAVLRLAMEYIADLGGVVAQHAVDGAMSAHGYMHEGAVSSRLGMYGIPSEAEEIVIARDLALVRLTGVSYHVQHVSTARGVALIRSAKADGQPVTAEVTPHHLAFDHTDVASTDADFKMMPPLRSERDRDALIAGLQDGTIDIVATDHAPHAPREKEVPFEHAPNGVIGLEWSAAVTNSIVGDDQSRFFDALSSGPARIAQIADHGKTIAKGNTANLVVFDPQERWTPTTSVSRSRNAPYFGRELTGRVRATILAGRITYGSST
ncbi:MAG: amidohydrolase family protein [Proteobacteria bacterium]|nr:amidohydrolase family protein [Pseudomonadota bacterium]